MLPTNREGPQLVTLRVLFEPLTRLPQHWNSGCVSGVGRHRGTFRADGKAPHLDWGVGYTQAASAICQNSRARTRA